MEKKDPFLVAPGSDAVRQHWDAHLGDDHVPALADRTITVEVPGSRRSTFTPPAAMFDRTPPPSSVDVGAATVAANSMHAARGTNVPFSASAASSALMDGVYYERLYRAVESVGISPVDYLAACRAARTAVPPELVQTVDKVMRRLQRAAEQPDAHHDLRLAWCELQVACWGCVPVIGKFIGEQARVSILAAAMFQALGYKPSPDDDFKAVMTDAKFQELLATKAKDEHVRTAVADFCVAVSSHVPIVGGIIAQAVRHWMPS